jgi:hypothetical protein
MYINFFDKGYVDGVSDGFEGRKMDFTKFPESLKSFASQKDINSYYDGYKQGYSAGAEKMKDVYS